MKLRKAYTAILQ